MVTVLFLFAAAYFVACLELALPYRPFPSDDYAIAVNLGMQGEFSRADYYNPTYLTMLHIIRWLIQLVGEGGEAAHGMAFVYLAALSNAAIMVVLGIFVWRVTKNGLAAIVAQVLFATSSWTTTYLLMVSYTPFAASLFLLALFLIYIAWSGSRRRPLLLMCAGIVLSLFFWSAPYAPALLLISLWLAAMLFSEGKMRERITGYRAVKSWEFRRFFGAFIIPTLLLMPFHGRQLVKHLYANIYTEHYVQAFEKFGYMPKPPALTYFHVAYEHSPLLVIVGTIAVLFALYIFARTRISGGEVLVGLVALIMGYSVLIEILQFTRLGRVYFPIWPIGIAAIVISFVLLIRFVAEKIRTGQGMAIGLALSLGCAAIAGNMVMSNRLITARSAGAEFIEGRAKTQKIYVLTEDPHAIYIMRWLNFGKPREVVKEINLAELVAMVRNRNVDLRRVALVVGPTGKKSGNSIMRHGVLPDYYPESIKSYRELIKNCRTVEMLPYYAYQPAFLMEEEISQALYFADVIPDTTGDPGKSLKFLSF